ncbi:MAG: GNAT family N-acetyltransferase [Paracoccaceae bacterium]|jgi:GNAT superfamily N-acetyltransferase
MNHKPEPFTPDDPSFKKLVSKPEAQGHGFVGRFAARWASGEFLFDKPGEKLLAIRHDHQIIAFGRICFDPYSSDPNAGRLRHLYVLEEWRGRNLGASLVSSLTDRPHPFAS